jgi:hypothetical protein
MKFIFLLAIVVLSGCIGSSNRGGHTRNISATSTNELFQSANPATASTQTIERTVERVAPVANDAGNVTRTTEKISTSIGAAQIDNSTKLKASFAAMRPVQWIGIVLILGALALCYFQWWTKAAICGAVGIGMIVVAAVIPGHEGIILAAGGAVAAIACLLVLYVYHKGHLDALSAKLPANVVPLAK